MHVLTPLNFEPPVRAETVQLIYFLLSDCGKFGGEHEATLAAGTSAAASHFYSVARHGSNRKKHVLGSSRHLITFNKPAQRDRIGTLGTPHGAMGAMAAAGGNAELAQRRAEDG